MVDLSLPGDGEANIARRLIGRDTDLRLIVLSVHDEPSIVGQLLSAGVAGLRIGVNTGNDRRPVRAPLSRREAGDVRAGQ